MLGVGFIGLGDHRRPLRLPRIKKRCHITRSKRTVQERLKGLFVIITKGCPSRNQWVAIGWNEKPKPAGRVQLGSGSFQTPGMWVMCES